ncbi:MAG: hypothetical protein ACI89L_000991 [Phycisphaerales bacterium]|jgi:hypothetical protein
MPRISDETRRLLDETIERLTAMQQDLASEPEDVLRSFLAEEVERSMGKLDASEHAGFLEELHSRFPTMVDGGGVASQAAEPPQRRRSRREGPRPEGSKPEAPKPEAEQPTPTSQNPETREPVSASPSPAPTGPVSTGPAPTGTAPSAAGRVRVDARLAKVLGLKPDDEIDAEKAVEMLGLLAEMTKGLDQVMWSTWKVLSPRSPIKGSGEVTRAMGAYAAGRDGVEAKDVQRSVERLRQLSASLVSAISQTGRQFAQQHAERFGPEHIEEWSAREKKSMESAAAVCWRKYKEMYGTADEATIEREIMQQIADYGERLMSGMDRVETKG